MTSPVCPPCWSMDMGLSGCLGFVRLATATTKRQSPSHPLVSRLLCHCCDPPRILSRPSFTTMEQKPKLSMVLMPR